MVVLIIFLFLLNILQYVLKSTKAVVDKKQRQELEEKVVELSKALDTKQKLLNILKSAVTQQPVAILKYRDATFIKQSFEVKANGAIQCRVKMNNTSEEESRKRINVQGLLAYRYYMFDKFIPAGDLVTILQNPDDIAIKKLENSLVE